MASNLKRAVLNLAKPIVLPVTRAKLKSFYQGTLPLTPIGTEKVLVLAPHVDDETIGLGGTLNEHLNKGGHVTVAYITDGSGSVSSLAKAELIQKRKEEAEAVQKLFGFQSIRYLDLPDGRIESNDDSRTLMLELLEDVRPEIVYCPTFVDCHPDHVATGRILADVLASEDNTTVQSVRLYEINCPIPPNEINVVVNITDSLAKKEEAVEIFQSQAIDFDGFIELSKLKAELTKEANVRAVETFLQIPAALYPAQFQEVDKDKHRYSHLFKQVNKAVTLLWGIFKNLELKKQIYGNRHKETKGA
ncbi:PIG-L family deacetylase [Robertmurraya sp. DFI.2.37]|nr:PIG-L family deacetylase [Robertmurraya sp. DFI.2.37]MDF1510254.1 PIG-L family deacetylase [Robertmurraya sp. DFI.2.37]